MLLMIDNYDSFTFNIVQYFRELGVEVKVVKNDELSLAALVELNPSWVVVSPGPCSPAEAGISVEAITCFAGKVPVLGVCLGHQCIAQAYGGRVVRATQVMHGKTSQIHHGGKGIFCGLSDPFTATRYHSLVVDKHSLPSELEMTAWTENAAGDSAEMMGIRHRTHLIEGVQFHPESVLSEFGHQLLENFLKPITR